MKKTLLFICLIGLSCGQKRDPTLTPEQINEIRDAEVPMRQAQMVRDQAQRELDVRAANLKAVIDKMNLPKGYIVDEDPQTFKISLRKAPEPTPTPTPTTPPKGPDKK
jgi:hypothetical protein